MEPPGSVIGGGTFTQTRLNRPSLELSGGFNALKTNIDILNAVKAFRKDSKTAYSLGVDVLNAVLHAVYVAFPSADGELVCIDVNSRKLRCPPYQHFNSRTDFAILPKSTGDALKALKLAPAYHHTVSLGELKVEGDKSTDPTQCMAYLGIAGQALPHRVSLLGFSMCSGGYTLHWSSPSGVDCSTEFDWDELQPLLEYAYTLYHPPADKLHLFFDETVTLSDGLSLSDNPRWDVTVEGVDYKRCEVRMVGEPWGRMSWVAFTEDNYVIKDQYRSDDSTFTEGDMYETVHEAGFALGFADMISYTPIKSHKQLIQVKVGDLQRLASIFEAHRHAVRRNVLHRDLSMANILINPKFARTLPKKPYDDDKRPHFINEVMYGVKNAYPEALIIDLDNACKYKRGQDEERGPLHERTGTPKYIARAVAVGSIISSNGIFDEMPKLPTDLRKLYKDGYDGAYDHSFRTFKDSKGKTHGGTLSQKKVKKYLHNPQKARADFKHRPRHDVESVFWCTVVFLVMVLPKTAQGVDDDANNGNFNAMWANFRDHEIPDNGSNDTRSSILSNPQDWSKILHEELAFVAPFLDELLAQVRPEYSLLKPPPHKFNLHESMQRLIFKYLGLWKDQNVEFHAAVQRKTIIISGQNPTSRRFEDGHLHNVSKRTASKRKATVANLPERPSSPKPGEAGEEVNRPVVGNRNSHKRAKVTA
ncbi:hypothetical protein ONZ45_g18138 [Pleurotus djamor]|nr:hypothetical protein ONZ45_g18138 [Pleurotus djamor]